MARLIDTEDIDYENIMCSQSQLHWLERIIEKQPTVDAVEVVHGRWVDKEDYYIETGMTCSVCCERYWFEMDRIDFKPYNYCPNCGAQMMDGDGNA